MTELIPDIIEVIKKIQDRGFAYEVDGDVYFDTAKYKEYGQLSKQDMEELEAGARIEVGEQKKNPMDFALWKKQNQENQHGIVLGDWEDQDGILSVQQWL